ncbi:hypothetical protein B0H19DRAFT_1086262 [Mycena capillaripes]|nr:hypothetical protein B0H19DRAFT_1086262 [Mycena capillaripes]
MPKLSPSRRSAAQATFALPAASIYFDTTIAIHFPGSSSKYYMRAASLNRCQKNGLRIDFGYSSMHAFRLCFLSIQPSVIGMRATATTHHIFLSLPNLARQLCTGRSTSPSLPPPMDYDDTPTTRLAATAEAAQERRGTAMGDVDDDEGREDEYESESESNSEVQMRAEQGKSSLFSMGSGNLEAVVETERMSQELRIELVGLRECGLKPENGKQKDKLRGKGRRVERQEPKSADQTDPGSSADRCSSTNLPNSPLTRASALSNLTQSYCIWPNIDQYHKLHDSGCPIRFQDGPPGRKYERQGVRRVYSARLGGQNTTVGIYQGPGAEEEWRQDIAKYMSVRARWRRRCVVTEVRMTKVFALESKAERMLERRRI